jgi:hypothetical protein
MSGTKTNNRESSASSRVRVQMQFKRRGSVWAPTGPSARSVSLQTINFRVTISQRAKGHRASCRPLITTSHLLFNSSHRVILKTCGAKWHLVGCHVVVGNVNFFFASNNILFYQNRISPWYFKVSIKSWSL